MQHRYEHKIKNHNLDHEKIKKDSIFLKVISGIVSSLLISIPTWILGIILYNGLDKGSFYAPQRLEPAVRVRWSEFPLDYAMMLIIISVLFLVCLTFLILWICKEIICLRKPSVDLPSIPEKFRK